MSDVFDYLRDSERLALEFIGKTLNEFIYVHFTSNVCLQGLPRLCRC